MTKAPQPPKEPAKPPKKTIEKTKVIETLNPGSAVSIDVFEKMDSDSLWEHPLTKHLTLLFLMFIGWCPSKGSLIIDNE